MYNLLAQQLSLYRQESKERAMNCKSLFKGLERGAELLTNL